MNVRENYMVSNLSVKKTYVGSIPTFPTLFFVVLCLFSLFTSCGLEPAGAQPIICGDVTGETRVDIGGLAQPLVDPYAKDNKPEDVLRHFVSTIGKDEMADIVVVIGATPDQYDEIMGSYLSPAKQFYYGYYTDERYYGEITNPNGIVFVPWGYEMFGYKFVPSRYDIQGKIIHFRRTYKYEMTVENIYRTVGLEWKFSLY